MHFRNTPVVFRRTGKIAKRLLASSSCVSVFFSDRVEQQARTRWISKKIYICLVLKNQRCLYFAWPKLTNKKPRNLKSSWGKGKEFKFMNMSQKDPYLWAYAAQYVLLLVHTHTVIFYSIFQSEPLPVHLPQSGWHVLVHIIFHYEYSNEILTWILSSTEGLRRGCALNPLPPHTHTHVYVYIYIHTVQLVANLLDDL